MKRGKREREVKLERAQVDIPVVESSMERQGARKVGHVHLAGFTSGAHGEVSQAVRKLLREGADGIVLDLRDNGGGLLNEAVLVSSIFIPEGKIVSTKGRSRARARLRGRRAARSRATCRSPCSSTAQSASASEIVTGALQDRKRAKVVGTRTFGKGVFQEIERSPTAARWTSPSASTSCPAAATSAAAASRRATASRPTSRPPTTRRPSRDEALDEAVDVVLRDGT